MHNKKSGKFKSVTPKRKVTHRFDRHQAKICLNPNFLAYSKSPWTGQTCICGFMGKIFLGRKFLRF